MQVENPYGASVTAPEMNPIATARTVSIERIDASSAGKLMGVMYALLGLLSGGIMFVVGIIQAVMTGEYVSILGGLFFLFMIPLFYGVIGLVGGVLGAAIYNFVAKIARGGIRIDLGA